MTPRPGPSPATASKIRNDAAGGGKSRRIAKGRKARGSSGDFGNLKQLTLEESVTSSKTKKQMFHEPEVGTAAVKVGGTKRLSDKNTDSPPRKRRSSSRSRSCSQSSTHKQLDIRVMVNKAAQNVKAPEKRDNDKPVTEPDKANKSLGEDGPKAGGIDQKRQSAPCNGNPEAAVVKPISGKQKLARKNPRESVEPIDSLPLPSDHGSEQDSDSDVPDVPEGEYEVETIVDFWDKDGTEQYLVKWKHYSLWHNTWEPKSNLLHCEEKMTRFFLRRLDEIRKVKEQYKDDKKELKRVLNNLPLPEQDPRSLDEQLKYFQKKISHPLTEEEIKINFQSYKLGRLRKYTKGELQLALRAAILGKFSDVSLLHGQMAILEGESRYNTLQKSLKSWEHRLNKITNGRPKITVENLVDLEGPPKDFTYRNKSVAGKGVVIPTDPLTGCDCDTTCGKGRDACIKAHFDFQLSYTKYKRVKVPNGFPIYECNQHCRCGPDCANRVVQDGTVSLAGAEYCIFRTSNNCGWGVRTMKPIKKGTFVALYAGEVIKSDDAEKRGPTYDKEGLTYLFDLDFNRSKNPYTIDAKHVGNISHFINHSCEPNLHVYNVFVECVDPDMPKLALFAARDIKQNEELSFDYMSNGLTNKRNKRNPLQLMTCHCGTKSCKIKVF